MADQSPSESGSHKYSCRKCHQRKVKCDRQDPCGYCVRHSDLCVYETPPPPKRRKREHKTDHGDLLARLQRAEDQLRLSGLMPPGLHGSEEPEVASRSREETSNVVSTPARDATVATPSGHGRKSSATQGRLITRGTSSRYLDNNLWVSLDNELQNPHELLQDNPGTGTVNENIDENYFDNGDRDEGAEMLLNTGTVSDQALVEHFSSVPQSIVLWQVYIDNIHNLCMIVHRPSFAKVVEQARTEGILSLPKNKIALLFSTFFFAVASMNNTQCEAKLRQPRKQLLIQLRNGTKFALVKAGFIRSTDMVTLQAFVQFLLCMRNGYDSQTLWVLSGAAFRIAQRMGIHREDANSSLPPFEAEMRRRLWRQLLILDFTSSELAGSAPGYTVMMGLDSNSRIPLNLNDDDLYEDMKELPAERYGATDMMFCRLRYEFGSFFLFLHKSKGGTFDSNFQGLNSDDTPLAAKDRHIEELENKLQTQYLRFCDPINRLHSLTTIAARAAINGMRLRAHHPRQYADGGKNMPQEEKDLLWTLSIRVMKYDIHCHAQKDLQGYLWHVRVYFQWHAFIYLLNELRIRRVGDEVDKAWELVEEVLHYHPEIMMSSDFALYRAIRSITLRAWDAREAEVRRLGMFIVTPDIINSIRTRAGVQTRNGPTSQAGIVLPTPHRNGSIMGHYNQYDAPAPAPEAIMVEHAVANHAATPYSVSWPPNSMPGEDRIDPSIMELPKPGEPSPIDWDAWDSLVQNMDLPTLEFGLDAFFK